MWYGALILSVTKQLNDRLGLKNAKLPAAPVRLQVVSAVKRRGMKDGNVEILEVRRPPLSDATYGLDMYESAHDATSL